MHFKAGLYFFDCNWERVHKGFYNCTMADKQVNFSVYMLTSSDPFLKICERVASANNFHKTNDTCFSCCTADVCNTGCNNVDHEVTANTTPSGHFLTKLSTRGT
jgi:radical SAM protein with 4Fe4S-binding SPASM domain